MQSIVEKKKNFSAHQTQSKGKFFDYWWKNAGLALTREKYFFFFFSTTEKKSPAYFVCVLFHDFTGNKRKRLQRDYSIREREGKNVFLRPKSWFLFEKKNWEGEKGVAALSVHLHLALAVHNIRTDGRRKSKHHWPFFYIEKRQLFTPKKNQFKTHFPSQNI